MRTTYTPDPDVAAAVENLRREQGLGPSDAINQLIRRGITAPVPVRNFTQRTKRMTARIDVTNIGETLATLDDQ